MPRPSLAQRIHHYSPVLALIAATVNISQCLDHGWFCPPPPTGDLCIDFPGYCDSLYKTGLSDTLHQATTFNISPLYQFDAFDWTVLIIYFGILTVLAIYGVYRVKQVIEFWRYSRFPPTAKGSFAENDLPHITVQLPLFNEMYVVERLVKSVSEIDYPRDRLEIQVLDDSTDETVNIALSSTLGS